MTQAAQPAQTTGALLVSLTLSEFGSNKRDVDAGLEVVSSKGAEDNNAARVWKSLFPKGSAMDDVKANIRALRNFHYRNTHAYMHDGPRVLPTKNYQAYCQGVRELEDALERTVLILVAELESIKEVSKKRMGQLYKEADYPTGENLKNSYHVALKFSPMPAAEMLLDIGLEPADMARMRKDLQSELRSTYAQANKRLWTDLHERLAKMISQMGNAENGGVHDKTYEGLKSLVDLLPRMNLTNDQALDSMASRLQQLLAAAPTSSELRRNDALREKVKSEATQVFGVMSAFMGVTQPRSELKLAA